MGAVNRAMLVGHVAADPLLYRTDNDRHRCTFIVLTGDAEDGSLVSAAQPPITRSSIAPSSIAPTSRGASRGGPRVAADRQERHRVVVWGRRAERCAENLHRGCLVYVEGRLRRYAFTGRDGQRRVIVEIVAQRVSLLDHRQRGVAPIVEPPPPGKPRGIYHAQPDFSRILSELLDD